MAIDIYSACPGGRDKKIKFCCPDLAGDLEQITQKLRGGQFAGVLDQIKRLEEKNPDCACLTTYKIEAFLSTQRLDEAFAAAAQFVEREPGNPVANAYQTQSLAIANGTVEEALTSLIRSFELTPYPNFHEQTLIAVQTVMARCVQEGDLLPALGLGYCASRFENAMQDTFISPIFRMYSDMMRSDRISTALKEMVSPWECPETAAFKKEFEEALDLFERYRWKEALAKYESIAEQADAEFPQIWANIASVRAVLLDIDGCFEALERLAAADIPMAQRIEARYLKLLLEDNPFGDQEDVLEIEYEITNFDRALELLLSWDQSVSTPINTQGWDVERMGPAPKNAFQLLDRPQLDENAEVTDLNEVPKVIGNSLLYGKQMDRPARLTIHPVMMEDRDELDRKLKESLGDNVGQILNQEVVDRSSRMFRSLFSSFAIQGSIPQAEFQKLSLAYHRSRMQSWVGQPLKVLDGKTPKEAATDPNLQVMLYAVLGVLTDWLSRAGTEEVVDESVKELGLPTVDVVGDPNDLAEYQNVTSFQLRYLDLKPLNNETLQYLTSRAIRLNDIMLQLRVADEILGRDDSSPDLRMVCYNIIIAKSPRLTTEQQLELCQKAKDEAKAKNLPDGRFDLAELQIFMEQGEQDKFSSALQHLMNNHMDDQVVAAAVQNILMSMGLINPDGSQATSQEQVLRNMARMRGVDPNQMMGGPMGAGPEAAQPAAEGGGLWTPDGGAPKGPDSGAGGSKIWTPDMG